MDILYPSVSFASSAFDVLRSRKDGDGGLSPGRLVFAEDLRRFISTRKPGASLPGLIEELTGHIAPLSENVGGPSAVALIHAAQMLDGDEADVEYYGLRGDDGLGDRLERLLRRTPLKIGNLYRGRGSTPSTVVLSDPEWDSGRGERCFINEIGAAAEMLPCGLEADFFGSDVVVFGGTALTPALHDGLPELLSRARASGALTVVNTVFDFRNERRNPGGAWPLGPASDGVGPGPRRSYETCDLLIADRDEALRLAGVRDLRAAIHFLESSGVGAFIITRGGDDVVAWAGKGRFERLEATSFPVSERARGRIKEELRLGARSGDTTGCGDAFSGGVVASLAEQISAGRPAFDLAEAAGWGIAGGATTLFLFGGTYYESSRGEKRAIVESFHRDWVRQIGG